MRKIEKYNTENNIESIINIDVNRFKLFLMNIENLTESTTNCYTKYIRSFKHILIDFYDKREEIEKDIWYYKKIQGVKIPSSDNRGTLNSIDFRVIPEFYRDIVKRYFISFITKRSVSHCQNVYKTIKVFFNIFYKLGYKDGFLKELTRYDIEKYLYSVSNEYKDKNVTYVNKFISYPEITQVSFYLIFMKENLKEDHYLKIVC